MLDQIAQKLEREKRITHWQIIRNIQRLHQLYSVFGQVESRRTIQKENHQVRVFARTSTESSQQFQGSSLFTVVPGERKLEEKIQDAIHFAELQKNPVFYLPEPGQFEYPDFEDVDTGIRDTPDAVLHDLSDRVNQFDKTNLDVRVSSSEFFLAHTDKLLLNSHGLRLKTAQSSLLWDIVLLYQNHQTDTEFWTMFSRMGTQYLRLEDSLKKFSIYAKDSATASPPAGGRCPVVITGDALHVLFSYFIFHSSAYGKYTGGARFSPGEPVVQGDILGDRLTMYSNSILPGGTQSARFDSDGLPGGRHLVIENGELKKYWGSKQYADYLKISPTGSFGNIEIPPGSLSWEQLLADSRRVILIIQFSTFDPQPVSGDFLGEIRVGYEYRPDGRVVPLRGGSVSGNIADGMKNCKFSRETALFENYSGPKGIRLENIQVAGK